MPESYGATTTRGPMDLEAANVVALLREHISGNPHHSQRGLARELAICTLMLERAHPGMPDENLLRIVACYRRSKRNTPAMLKKCASHARALLRFGEVQGKPLLAVAACLDGHALDVLAAIDQALLQVSLRETLAHRAHEARKGGRESMSVLKALVDLSERADDGDEEAQTELRLISAFFRPANTSVTRERRDRSEKSAAA